jgi:hypothetical protein
MELARTLTKSRALLWVVFCYPVVYELRFGCLEAFADVSEQRVFNIGN